MNIEDIIKTNSPIPLSRKVIINLIHTESRISDKISAVLKPHGITIQQFNVLRILRGQKGNPANLSTIQERMVSKMSNTTRLVDKLIDKAYVSKEICHNNRRKVEISITGKGLKFLEIVSREVNELENKITSHFTDEELKVFNKMLTKLREDINNNLKY